MPDIRVDHLLERARASQPVARGAPRQADLRRGVSDAYYALFHAVTEAVAHQILDGTDEAAKRQFRRTLRHARLAEVSRSVARGRSAGPAALSNTACSDSDARLVASTFDALRVEREAADYDHTERFTALRLADAIHRAEVALEALRRGGPGIASYLSLLAPKSDWTSGSSV